MHILKKIIKPILTIFFVVLALVFAYFIYALIDYHRAGDNIELAVEGTSINQIATTDTPYQIVSYNIGFGAYESDYGFFMDGGSESRAWSKDRVLSNMSNIGTLLGTQKADFYFIQEVDTDSTRSYHVDEASILREYINQPNVWAINYDSPYLFYPILEPHGKSVSGIMTFSGYNISESLRKELPIETSLKKYVDLDRCYSISYVPLDNGKWLCLYNFHLSAYTSDGSIATEQLKLLLEDMQQQYELGNYIVGGGDFNKDLLVDSGKYFGDSDIEYTWAQPIPMELFDSNNLSLIAPLDMNNPIPSCRNADGPYYEGQYVLTVDGFIVSDNILVSNANVYDSQFAYSDHNPVYMTFELLS